MTVPDPTAVSLRWLEYFRRNAWTEQEMPWSDSRRLTPAERRAVAASIQQFQLGEGASGRGLQRRGAEFAARAGDPFFGETLRLFIAEEQRHSVLLGRWMELEGIPRLRRHWVDQTFRGMRKLAGLEVTVTVLSTAEIIAVPYYRALRNATGSPLLRALCERILLDEAAHLRFQAWNLARLRESGAPAWRGPRWRAHECLLAATSLVVWREHGPVFRAAGYRYDQFASEARGEFRALRAQAANHARNGTAVPLDRPEPAGPGSLPLLEAGAPAASALSKGRV